MSGLSSSLVLALTTAILTVALAASASAWTRSTCAQVVKDAQTYFRRAELHEGNERERNYRRAEKLALDVLDRDPMEASGRFCEDDCDH